MPRIADAFAAAPGKVHHRTLLFLGDCKWQTAPNLNSRNKGPNKRLRLAGVGIAWTHPSIGHLVPFGPKALHSSHRRLRALHLPILIGLITVALAFDFLNGLHDSACELLEGIPAHHVIRFQEIAPIKDPKITPASTRGRSPDSSVTDGIENFSNRDLLAASAGTSHGAGCQRT